MSDVIESIKHIFVKEDEFVPYQPTDEQIRVAVEWWKNAIKTPTYDFTTADERANDPATARTAAMTDVIASSARPIKTKDEVENFGIELTKLLEVVSERPGAHSQQVIFGTDYGPGQLLFDAAENAGIGSGMLDFPWKTLMWLFKDGRVEVRHGYGADAERLL